MAGSRLASWARGLCWWLGPPFSTEGSLPRTAGIYQPLYALASRDRWERHEAKRAAHGGSRGWKIHSLLGFGANKSQRMQTVQRGFIALPQQGLGRLRDLAPNHLDWPLVPSPHGPSLVQELHMLALSRCSREL